MPATVVKRGKKKGPPSSSNGGVGNYSESAMDEYLKTLDLYRKSIAKDGSCLFRAVSEQVYHCQAKHLQVRKECIEFMQSNREKFEEFLEGPFDHHLFKLQNPKEWAGQVEMSALSLMYKKDFVVYQDINADPTKVTDNGFKDKILLCFSNGNHYDAVYTQQYWKNASMCQSIIFELLYHNVFGKLDKKESRRGQQTIRREDDMKIPDLFRNGDANNDVDGQDNEQDEEGWTKVQSKSKGKSSRQNKNYSEHEEPKTEETSRQQNNDKKYMWEINRSLSLQSYRNVELEAWEEAKHDQQQKDWIMANNIQYRKNDRCLAQLSATPGTPEKIYTVIINDVNMTKQMASVFVPELKERMTISLQNLKPQEPITDSYKDLSGYYRKTESNGPVNEDGEKFRKKRDRGPRPRRNFPRGEDLGEEGNQRRGNAQDEPPQRQRPGSGRERVNKRRENRFSGRGRDDRKALEDEEERRFINEQTKLFELQEKDPKAFPALPSAQESRTPKPKTVTTQESQNVTIQEKVVPPPAPVPPPEVAVDQSPAAFWSRLKNNQKQVPTTTPKDTSTGSLEQQNTVPAVVTGQQTSPAAVSATPLVSKTADQMDSTILEKDQKPDSTEKCNNTESVGDKSTKVTEEVLDSTEKEKHVKGGNKGPNVNALEKIVKAPVIPSKSDLEDLPKRRISVEVKHKPEELPKAIPMPPVTKNYELENKKPDVTRKDEKKKEYKELQTENVIQPQLTFSQNVDTEIPFPTQPSKTIEELVKSNPPVRFEKTTKGKPQNKKTEGPQNDLPKLNNSPKTENCERTEGITPKSIIMTSNGSSKIEKKTVKFQDPPETSVEKLHSYECDKEDTAELGVSVSGPQSAVTGQQAAAGNHNTVARQPYPQLVKREPGILPVSSLPSSLGTENKGFIVENSPDKPNAVLPNPTQVQEPVSILTPTPTNLETAQDLKPTSSPVSMDGSQSPEETTQTTVSASQQGHVPGTQSQPIGYVHYGPMLTVPLDANDLPTDINVLKHFYNLGVQYYQSMMQGIHANTQPMMIYPMYQEHIQPQAQTPVSMGQQHFAGTQQPVFYSPQPPMQQYTHQAMHMPPVSQESASYGERNNTDRPNTAVQQTAHSLPPHQQVAFHPPMMGQHWRQQRPQQTFNNTNFGHQNKSGHGYNQHQNTGFQNNRQTHQGSSYSKQQHNKPGHKKHSNKQQHHRNEMLAQNPYASTGGQQLHAQSANATMSGAQPFAAGVTAATGNPGVASNTYFVGGDHLQGNKSSGDYYGQGNQGYRPYQHSMTSGMAQGPHNAANSRSPFTQ